MDIETLIEQVGIAAEHKDTIKAALAESLEKEVKSLEESIRAELSEEFDEKLIAEQKKIEATIEVSIDTFMNEHQEKFEKLVKFEQMAQFMSEAQVLFAKAGFAIDGDVLDEQREAEKAEADSKYDTLIQKLVEEREAHDETKAQAVELERKIAFNEAVEGLASTDVARAEKAIRAVVNESMDIEAFKSAVGAIVEGFEKKDEKKDEDEDGDDKDSDKDSDKKKDEDKKVEESVKAKALVDMTIEERVQYYKNMAKAK